MRRSRLIVLLVLGAVCAGIGAALALSAPAPASTGWTAYSPLSSSAYQPSDATWAPRVGLALLTVGAGTTGAAMAALVLVRPGRAR